MERAEGYYWVRTGTSGLDRPWQIALFELGTWWIMYRDWALDESEIEEIGERIPDHG